MSNSGIGLGLARLYFFKVVVFFTCSFEMAIMLVFYMNRNVKKSDCVCERERDRDRQADRQRQIIRQKECKTRNKLAHRMYIIANY